MKYLITDNFKFECEFKNGKLFGKRIHINENNEKCYYEGSPFELTKLKKGYGLVVPQGNKVIYKDNMTDQEWKDFKKLHPEGISDGKWYHYRKNYFNEDVCFVYPVRKNGQLRTHTIKLGELKDSY